VEPISPEEAVDMLVHELLLERTRGLSGAQLAAFVDGWSSLLDLVRRTDLLLPGAGPELIAAITDLVARIQDSQRRVLDDDD
jgi:hypothetical protein